MPHGTHPKSTIDSMALILEAASEEDFLKRVVSAAGQCGFEMVSMGLKWQDSHGETHFRVASNYPEAWQLLYFSRAYMAKDPVVRHCLSSTEPLFWSEALFAEADAMDILEGAKAFGLGHGISVPTHDGLGLISALNLARKDTIDLAAHDTERLLRCAKVIASCAHIAFRTLCMPDIQKEMERPLSQQERSCLRCVAMGMTSSEVATSLGVSDSTVIFHIKNAIDKLGTKSRAHAIAVAFRMGLLI